MGKVMKCKKCQFGVHAGKSEILYWALMGVVDPSIQDHVALSWIQPQWSPGYVNYATTRTPLKLHWYAHGAILEHTSNVLFT